MPTYVTVQLVLKDMEAFARYREVGGDALRKHNGRYIAGGPDSEELENSDAGDCIMVLLEFPDAANARNWINDPELQHVHEMRKAGANTRVSLLAAV